MPTLKEMRKSFALCEAFGLTPFPSPWIPSAHEGLSAGTGRPGRRHSRQGRRGPPLPARRCAARSAVQVPLRAAARGSGVGVEDDHGRSACSRGAAVKLHVETTSRS